MKMPATMKTARNPPMLRLMYVRSPVYDSCGTPTNVATERLVATIENATIQVGICRCPRKYPSASVFFLPVECPMTNIVTK